MFLLNCATISGLEFCVKVLGKQHLLSISAKISFNDDGQFNYLLLPIATNQLSFRTNATIVEETHNDIRLFAQAIRQHYPNFPIACIPLNVSQKQFVFMYTFRYTPFREDMFFISTLESSFDDFDPDKEVYCNYSVSMSTKKDVWCKRKFTGWQQNADTLAAVEYIEAGMSDMMVRRSLWGLWHG